MSESVINAYWQESSSTLLCVIEGMVDISLVAGAIGQLRKELDVENVIWDFRKSDASNIRAADLRFMARNHREEERPRLKGKVVYLVNTGSKHDKVARFISVDNMERTGTQNAQVFSTSETAIDWLGIDLMPDTFFRSYRPDDLL